MGQYKVKSQHALSGFRTTVSHSIGLPIHAEVGVITPPSGAYRPDGNYVWVIYYGAHTATIEWNGFQTGQTCTVELTVTGEDFPSLTDDLGTPVSGSGDALFRMNGEAIEASIGGDRYRRIFEPSVLNIKDYGAIGDGASHPLSEVYSTLALAQVVYSFATSLTQQLDWAALQLAFNESVSGGEDSQCGTIVFAPRGTYLLSDPAVLITKASVSFAGAGASATLFKAYGANVAGEHLIEFRNCVQCVAENFALHGASGVNQPLSGFAITNEASAALTYGQPSKNTLSKVWIGYDSSTTFDYGIYVGGDTNANNDFHSFYDVSVTHTDLASFYVPAANTQAFDHLFLNCFFNYSGYGVRGPGWTWVGGGIGGNTEADFEPGTSPCRILGGNGEASARFIYASSAPGVSTPLHITGFRWSADDTAHADNNMIVFPRAGPLTIEGCRFDAGEEGRISKISLSAIRDSLVKIEGNVWNQPGADQIECITWNDSQPGEGYHGGVFRGGSDNNLYCDSTGLFHNSIVGARSAEAYLSADPVKGQWLVGNRFYNLSPTPGGYLGKVCTTAGLSAPAWVNTTAYIVGKHVSNDTTRVYECITAGTSAGSGGPTGTGSDITDGTVHWKYVGVLAIFKGFGTIES